jgi:hypothetical protein
MPVSRTKIHRDIYIFGLILLAVSLPVSLFFTSVSELLLAANWLAEGRFKEKLNGFKHRKSLWFISSAYLIFILGMIYTTDFKWGLHDLRIKLPLLILPLIIGTSEKLSANLLKTILLFFVATIVVNSLISTYVYLGFSNKVILDVREISLFISHIRFSIMITFSILILIYYLLYDHELHLLKWEKITFGIVILWLLVFLVILQSLTGIFILIIILPFVLTNRILHLHSFGLKILFLSIETLAILAILLFITGSVHKFYFTRETKPENPEKYTINGNPYVNDPENNTMENGYYVWKYVCEPELRKEWNKRSSFPYDSLDRKGQSLKLTLIRYMTSLGYRKDSAGVSRLSTKDIRHIENGNSNVVFNRKFSLYPRIYQIIWEFDVYKNSGYASGHSITQRIEYLKTALTIIKKNYWFGVGTGDVKTAFHKAYLHSHTLLAKKRQHRAHNQLITFLLTYGIFGFVWIIIAFLYPVFLEKKWNNYLFIVILAIGFLSMLNEDMLETHTGVSFFAYFYALFLLGQDERQKKLQYE